MITAFHQPIHPITEPQKPTPAAYAVAECCAALAVSRSGYYDHLAKPDRPRHQYDEVLAGQIETLVPRQPQDLRRTTHLA